MTGNKLKPINVSIVMPTCDKLPRLKLTIESLRNQQGFSGEFELVLVNDVSTDGTEEYVQSLEVPFPITYSRIDVRKGRSFARNRGVQLAKHDLIIFIDDDLIVDPNFIAEHVAMQQKEQGVIHGKIANLPFLKYFKDPTEGEFYPWVEQKKESKLDQFLISPEDISERFEQKIKKFSKVTPLEKMIKESLTTYSGTIDWLAFNGGNLSIPKEWIDEAGGFDEAFGLDWGCEDLELGYRLFKQGKPFFYLESAVNYHIAHNRPNFEVEHKKTADLFYRKHNEPLVLAFQDFVANRLKRQDFIKIIEQEQEL